MCWAAEPSQVSSAKRACRDVAATLHLITPISVWNQYNSVIALQDSLGSVSYLCLNLRKHLLCIIVSCLYIHTYISKFFCMWLNCCRGVIQLMDSNKILF
ncbi:unnamed protein product [Trichobilharzia regenti]|nr:unnamed protein product [Trichobilharzia regenti]